MTYLAADADDVALQLILQLGSLVLGLLPLLQLRQDCRRCLQTVMNCTRLLVSIALERLAAEMACTRCPF